MPHSLFRSVACARARKTAVAHCELWRAVAFVDCELRADALKDCGELGPFYSLDDDSDMSREPRRTLADTAD